MIEHEPISPYVVIAFILLIASAVHVFVDSKRDPRIGHPWMHALMCAVVLWPLPYLCWLLWWPGKVRKAIFRSDRDPADGLAWPIIQANTAKRGRLATAIPPLFLLPLAVLPARGPQSVLLVLPIFLAILIATIILVIRCIQMLAKNSHNMRGLIRPSLTLLVCAIVLLNHHCSFRLAQAHAIQLARRVEQRTIEDGRSPENPGGWDKKTRAFLSDKEFYSSSIRRLGIRYPIHYHASSNGRAFTVVLVRGFNMQTTIRGGIDTEISAFHTDDGHTREIRLR